MARLFFIGCGGGSARMARRDGRRRAGRGRPPRTNGGQLCPPPLARVDLDATARHVDPSSVAPGPNTASPPPLPADRIAMSAVGPAPQSRRPPFFYEPRSAQPLRERPIDPLAPAVGRASLGARVRLQRTWHLRPACRAASCRSSAACPKPAPGAGSSGTAAGPPRSARQGRAAGQRERGAPALHVPDRAKPAAPGPPRAGGIRRGPRPDRAAAGRPRTSVDRAPPARGSPDP